VIAITDESIRTRSNQEVCLEVSGLGKQLIDVGFPITDMDAARRLRDQVTRLPHVLKPADAFLAFNRNASGVDLALQRIGSLEFLATPKLDRAQVKWQSVGGNSQTRVHQYSTHGVHSPSASLILASIGFGGESNFLRLVSLVRKLRGVLKYEQWARARLGPVARGLKVPGKDGVLVDIVVGQEPIRGLGAGPVLASERDRATDVAAKLMKQAAQSFAQSRVAEFAASNLASYPRRIVRCVSDSCHLQ